MMYRPLNLVFQLHMRIQQLQPQHALQKEAFLMMSPTSNNIHITAMRTVIRRKHGLRACTELFLETSLKVCSINKANCM